MVAELLTLLILGLVVYGLERNHARQVRIAGHLTGHLAGSTDLRDRDTERVLADLRVSGRLS